jgi:hypothetical protein
MLNDQPTPAWTGKFSLNGAISLLCTIFALGITGNAQDAIGQLKWVRFAKMKRNLYDVQSFDSGSRSPRGAIRLLKSQRSL